MTAVRQHRLRDVGTIITGRTPSTNKPGYFGGPIPFVTPADLDGPDMTPRTLSGESPAAASRTLSTEGANESRLVPAGSTLVCCIGATIGKVGIVDQDVAFNQQINAVVPNPKVVCPSYLFQALRNLGPQIRHLATSTTMPILSKSRFENLPIPVPPLAEQRRIATILDHSDAMRAQQRQVLSNFNELAESAFAACFGSDLDTSLIALDELAQVTSGITKGRRTTEQTSPVPFLAVANVQAGHLNMQLVKEIDATASEVERYALRDGDLVMTEGGDPDKLGRGTVWRNELPLCLHQNHIFRVRIRAGHYLHPDYLSAFIASRPARSYFLRAAKQTTGIASINMTQLKALPVHVPPVEKQEQYLSLIEAIRKQRTFASAAVENHDELFTSLQARAFRGEL